MNKFVSPWLLGGEVPKLNPPTDPLRFCAFNGDIIRMTQFDNIAWYTPRPGVLMAFCSREHMVEWRKENEK